MALSWRGADEGAKRMKIDSLAIATDWLDAYRAGDLEAILRFYADDAVIECRCGGTKVITGNEGIRAYWVQRLQDYPASDLSDLQPATEDEASISYRARSGIVRAVVSFNDEGLIRSFSCGPSRQVIGICA